MWLTGCATRPVIYVFVRSVSQGLGRKPCLLVRHPELPLRIHLLDFFEHPIFLLARSVAGSDNVLLFLEDAEVLPHSSPQSYRRLYLF